VGIGSAEVGTPTNRRRVFQIATRPTHVPLTRSVVPDSAEVTARCSSSNVSPVSASSTEQLDALVAAGSTDDATVDGGADVVDEGSSAVVQADAAMAAEASARISQRGIGCRCTPLRARAQPRLGGRSAFGGEPLRESSWRTGEPAVDERLFEGSL
jgi:hypothetical protein